MQIGGALISALLGAIANHVVKQREIKQVCSIMEQASTPNDEFRQVAVNIGAEAGRKLLNKYLK